ncbi:hypothetical protein ACJ72_03949 [Emergomyces africanus]|uniref:CID domain-containing protein n=1 Tax=Emergomyces africanus TaxID=1955775 RepID=A0A1B7NY51_9EURO|nr:hypothetical protein ACJ72_03949 [Emergomyces africanus]
MSAGLASDEVAEDYKNSLEDLTGNDKFQISNLTVIAKENTEHAMAISRVLENHIRTTPPAQKLPALYVVDSVVKNVGTPYTLFLGRNLYQTFMNAYTLVDSQTRKKLDEMLKTWKEPVPGSLDTRPVFPVEITRSIENALIKARTAALQNQQARSHQDILGRNRGITTPPTTTTWRNTPTPPQIPPRYTQSASQSVHQQYPSNGQHYPSTQQTQPYGQPLHESIDLDALHRDIENLISTARTDFANNPLDPSIQQRLKALLDLQNILMQQKLPQDQLKLIRDQVSQLSPQAPQPQPQPQPPLRVASTPPITQTILPIQSQTPQPNLQALLNPATIAELIKATTSQQSRTPPPPQPPHLPSFLQPQATSTPPPPVPTTAPTTTAPTPTENPLIASLRARGLLPPPTASAPPTPSNLPFILPGQSGGYTPPVAFSQLANPSEVKINVQMTSTSIRIPRPNLVFTLYEEKPNRCGTCGRRFQSDDQGKEKKARHLDWHFKTNQRMTEASKRGQSRSWYLDEREWIKSREYDDDTGDPTDEGATSANGSSTDAAAAAANKSSQKQWIHAPNDAALRNAPCPICQEKFESTWSEEAQDWIWNDASKVGNRIYHASCYSEVTKDGTATGRGTPVGRGTPDSVLGKRKAEESENATPSVRIKTEPAS